MNFTKSLSFLALAAIAFSCQNPTPETAAIPAEDTAAVAAEPALDIAATVAHIDELRTAIESNLGAPIEVSTAGLRAKTSQKWEKIHFYTGSNGEIVRIKTYPYATSKRTEEFYFDNGSLALAVIEDDGSGPKGKATDQMDKLYYFHSDEVIQEIRKNEEAEHGVRDSDGEELLAEAQEYLQLFEAQKAQ